MAATDHRHIAFSQNHIRRAGDALAASLQENFNDVYLLATKMLNAAIRHEADVVELIKPRNAPPQDKTAP